MGWQKKHDHRRPYKKVTCVSDVNCKLLREGFWYGVLEETETTYLIRFSTGAANWYHKNRFVDLLERKSKPKQDPKLDELLNKLF
jgi:hypothetical protein